MFYEIIGKEADIAEGAHKLLVKRRISFLSASITQHAQPRARLRNGIRWTSAYSFLHGFPRS